MANMKRAKEIEAQLRNDPKYMARVREIAAQKRIARMTPAQRAKEIESQILREAPGVYITNCDANGQPTAKSRVLPDFRTDHERALAKADAIGAEIVRDIVRDYIN